MSDSTIIKFLLGTATPEETDALFAWLNEDTANRLKYFEVKRIFLESHGPGKADVDQAWERMHLSLQRAEEDSPLSGGKTRRFSMVQILVAAALAILVVATTYFAFRLKNISRITARANEITVPYGSRISMVLPDGSKVWLNSGSKLTYNAGFGVNSRNVNLSGEAFFDIKHNAHVPFIVNTSDLSIRVLGTVFNVRSYPDDKVIETTLVRGRIEVNSLNHEGEQQNTIVLTPHEKLIYTKADRKMTYTTTDKQTSPQPAGNGPGHERDTKIKVSKIQYPENDGAWKDGKLILKSEPLEEITRQLERYYNVRIIFQNDSIRHIKFTGVLDQVTIEEVMRAISSASPIKYSIDKNVITLKYAKKPHIKRPENAATFSGQ